MGLEGPVIPNLRRYENGALGVVMVCYFPYGLYG